MNKVLSVVLINFFVTAGFAQSIPIQTIKDEIWKNPAPEFKVTAVPDKWQKESAVILASNFDYEADLDKAFKEKLVIHFRIKLQDKASVSNFSELSFDKKYIQKGEKVKGDYSLIGIKVIKPNGSEKEIDLSNKVEADAGDRDYKIAVPDLEPGDIIDYFITVKSEKYNPSPSINDEELLEENYPVIKKTLRFKLSNSLSFNSKSYNNAPKFTEKEVDKTTIYTLIDTLRDKSPDILWTYPHRTAPEIRYSIVSRGTESSNNPQTVAEKVANSLGYNYSDVGAIEDFIRGNFKGEKDMAKITKEVYYLLRNPLYLDAYFQIQQGRPLEVEYVPEKYFEILNKYLLYKKIAHQLMVVPSSSYGPIEELVNLSSCDLLIKTNTNPAIYLPRPTPFTIPNEFPAVFEGMSGVAQEYTSGNKEMKNSPLPESSADQNKSESNIKVTISLDNSAILNVSRNMLVKGHNKTYHQFLVFTNYDYLKEYDQPKYQVQSSNLMREMLRKYNKEKVKFEQRQVQDYHERDERIKRDLEKDLQVKVGEYKNLKVKSIGMWDYAPNTEYSDEFTIENLTNKAGNNLLLEIGKLIEEQTLVKDEQRKRSRDIYMSYPRSFYNTITLDIPAGYKVEGLETLNKKVETKQGGSVSTAEIISNQLVIKTKKYYNVKYVPAAEWTEMCKFLDAAVDFTKAKVLLKKV